MTVIGEAFVRIVGDTKDFHRQVTAEAETAGTTAGSKFSGGFSRTLKTLGGAVAAVGIAHFAADSVKQFEELDKAETRLEGAFKRFPQLAGSSAVALEKLSEELARKTKFDRASFDTAEATLAQFGLTADQIKRLTPQVADLATRTGTDLATAAQKLGLAFLGNTRVLKPLGVQFKATGDRAKDFETISAALQQRVGGVAETAGKKLPGQMAILRHSFEEIQVQVGSALVPILTKLAQTLISAVQFFQKLPGPVKLGIAAFGGLALAIGIFTKIVQFGRTVVQAFTLVQTALNAVLTANPIGLIVLAIAALVAGVILAYQHSETFRKIVQAAFAVVQAAAAALAAGFKVAFDFITGAVSFVVGFIKQNWDLLLIILLGPVGVAIAVYRRFGDDISGFFAALPGRIVGALGDFAGLLGGFFAAAFSVVRDLAFTVVSDVVGFYLSLPGRILTAVGNLGGFLIGLFGGAFNNVRVLASNVVGDVVSFFASLPGRIAGVVGSIGGVFEGVGRSILDGITRGVGAAVGFAGNFARAVGNAIIDFINRNIVQRINDAIPNSLSLGPIHLDLPDNPIPSIPRFHMGGVVPGPRGTEVLALLQGGERVVPPDQAGVQRVYNLNLNGPVASEVTDERRVRAMFRRMELLSGT